MMRLFTLEYNVLLSALLLEHMEWYSRIAYNRTFDVDYMGENLEVDSYLTNLTSGSFDWNPPASSTSVLFFAFS